MIRVQDFVGDYCVVYPESTYYASRVLSKCATLISVSDLSNFVSYMKFGVCVPNYGDTMSVEGIRAVGMEAEKLGYDSVSDY